MSRLPKSAERHPDGRRSENDDAGRPRAAGVRGGTPMGLGWRVCIFVWACGFGGLFLYEVWGLLWRVGKGMFGNGP